MMREPDNGRGNYAAVGTGHLLEEKHYRYAVVWRHGVSERVLVQFLGPNAARAIASDLNFRHVDEKTGEVTRNWSQLLNAWGPQNIPPVEHRIIAPGW